MRRLPCLTCLSILVALFVLPRAAPPAAAAEPYVNLGIYGGMVEDIVFVPGQPGTLFAATYEGGGLYRSDDGGSAWTAVAVDNDAGPADTFKNNDVFQIAVAPSDSQVIYVVHNDWVDISTDGGATWINVLNATMQRVCTDCGGDDDDLRLCQTVAVDPSDAAVAYVGTVGPHDTYVGGAIYKTTDTGQTWQKLNGGQDFDFAVKDLAIDPQDPNVVWAVTSSEGQAGWGGSLYRSGDGGESWQSILALTPYSAFNAVAVKPDDSNVVFTGSGYGVVKHTFVDGAWNLATGDTSLTYDLAFDPQDPNTLYASWLSPAGWSWDAWGGDGRTRVSRSTDGGASWEHFVHAYEFNALAVDPGDSDVLLAGDFGHGVFRSADRGETWTRVSNGLTAITMFDVAVDPTDTRHLLAATDMGLLERQTGSETWNVILAVPIRSIRFHPTDKRTIYAGTRRQGLAKTVDGGASWTFTAVPGPFQSGDNDVTDIALDPADSDRLFIAVFGLSNYGQVYRSTDGGATLTKVLDGFNQADERYPFNAVAVDPFDSNHVFAGGGRFYVPKTLGDLWESTDGGDTWQRTSLVDAAEADAGVIVNALLMDPTRQGVVYAGTGFSSESFHPLYASTDGGASWAELHAGFPMTSYNAVKDLAFHRESPDILYAATLARGIYISPNRGETWHNLGAPEFNVRALAVGSVYGATEGGLFQLTGTGCIFGDVADSATGGAIDRADVSTGGGIHSTTVAGEYVLISPAGVHDVTATASGYADATHGEVVVAGGGAVQRDFSLLPGSYALAIVDGTAPVDDSVVSFGNVAAGATAAVQVAVRNLGDATLTVAELDPAGTLPDSMALYDDGCSGAALVPAQSCTFELRFSPVDDSPVTASLAIAYGAASAAEARVTVYANSSVLSPPRLTAPADGAELDGDTVTFHWQGAASAGHYLYCSANPQFGLDAPYPVASAATAGAALAGAGAIGVLLGSWRRLRRRRRGRWSVLCCVLLLAVAVVLGSCANSDDGGGHRQHSRTVSGLEPGSTYYWKVVLDDGVGGHVESPTRSFTTR